MGDTIVSETWVVLTHHLPPEPAYLRVKVRRRLETLGAVAVKSSVYALPASEDSMEDLRWLFEEIVRSGGDASLATATFVDGVTGARLEARSREARGAEYDELIGAVSALVDAGAAAEAVVDAQSGRARRLAERLDQIRRIDFFGAPGRELAEQAIQSLLQPTTLAAAAPDAPVRGRTWTTRLGPKVDRIGSGWLIKRFIDPDATFRFVDPAGYAHAPGELRFDMFEGEYTHQGEACTFETLLASFGLTDPALRAVAEIVHDLDCKDGKFGRAETAGVAAVIDGIVRAESDDRARLERGGAFLDALYEHFSSRPS